MQPAWKRVCLIPTMAVAAVAMASALACGGGGRSGRTTASAPEGTSKSPGTRQPLSDEEERWIVELGRKLQSEAQPNPSEVRRAVDRLSQASGITVVLCGDILQLLMKEKTEIDLVAIVLVGSAAALLESPELSDDLPKMMTSGLRAAAQAYRSSRETSGGAVQALDELEARERAKSLEGWVETQWGTCPSTVKAARAQAQQKGNMVRVVPDSTSESRERPWGAPVPDAAQQAMVMTVMKAIAENKANADVLSTTFAIGPALYESLLTVDSQHGQDTVTTIGTKTIVVVPSGEHQHKLAMRTYLEQKHREALLKASPFRAAALAMSRGKSRAATEGERRLLYALIAFEIVDQPVTVIEMQKHVAVAYFVGERLHWLDMLSDYE